MAETRKKLTEIQFKQIQETQGALAQARALVKKTEAEAQRVVQLVFDAHSVPQGWVADLDDQTMELVCYDPATVVATEEVEAD